MLDKEIAEELDRRKRKLSIVGYRAILRKARKTLGRVLKESPTGCVIAKRMNEFGENDYQPVLPRGYEERAVR